MVGDPVKLYDLSCYKCGKPVQRYIRVESPSCVECKMEEMRQRAKGVVFNRRKRKIKEPYDYTKEPHRVHKNCLFCGQDMFVHRARKYCSSKCEREYQKSIKVATL